MPRTKRMLIPRLVTALVILLSISTAFSNTVDTATRQLSVNGLFDVSYQSQEESIPLNSIHQWVLVLRTPAGEPVSDATIKVNGGMPMHNHGLPTAPRITKELENGEYLVEGLKFQMAGHWTVEFEIIAGDATDKVIFNLML